MWVFAESGNKTRNVFTCAFVFVLQQTIISTIEMVITKYRIIFRLLQFILCCTAAG